MPPCLDYSARLLQWYARSSNSLPAFVVRARLAGDLVGFGMALPRRFRTNSWEGDGYIKSFMTVDPAARGRGIGVSLPGSTTARSKKARNAGAAFRRRDDRSPREAAGGLRERRLRHRRPRNLSFCFVCRVGEQRVRPTRASGRFGRQGVPESA
ncbi:MAG: GNAT family N-acetyltransferase [Gemmatimonadetes bacterium]|nr:GNAT family N-acetyltransferase [Gemmatimonadota bacterium]